MTGHQVEFSYRAPYYQLGELTNQTRQVWFVLHGYGQLARFFLKKFSALENPHRCVIAPEGLSRFYLEDVRTRAASGNTRVGATWMTRENRLLDIGNYIQYLNALYHRVVSSLKEPTHITLLGFSQGAATASRWALSEKIHYDQLILWAGIFPSDMNFSMGQRILSTKEVVVAYGSDDPFLTPERMKEMETLTVQLGIVPRILRYAGAHDIHEPTLLSLA
jgi:predicted esterase